MPVDQTFGAGSYIEHMPYGRVFPRHCHVKCSNLDLVISV